MIAWAFVYPESMMLYYSPPVIGGVSKTHVVRRRVFSSKTCNKIYSLCHSRWLQPKPGLRMAELASDDSPLVDQLFSEFAQLAATHNVWGVHLQNIRRALMVMEYRPESGAGRKHVDFMPHKGEHDKLALVVMLTDRSKYKGGDLVFDDDEHVKMDQGDLCVFPGYVMHGVEPVISGVRSTLICWVSGPAFV